MQHSTCTRELHTMTKHFKVKTAARCLSRQVQFSGRLKLTLGSLTLLNNNDINRISKRWLKLKLTVNTVTFPKNRKEMMTNCNGLQKLDLQLGIIARLVIAHGWKINELKFCFSISDMVRTVNRPQIEVTMAKRKGTGIWSRSRMLRNEHGRWIRGIGRLERKYYKD